MFEEDIFNELLKMRRRIERLMRSFGSLASFEEIESFPVDISETEKEIIVRADLPGFSKDEVSVNATENNLTIEAKHKEEKKEKGEKYYTVERKFGSFRRVISLPLKLSQKKQGQK